MAKITISQLHTVDAASIQELTNAALDATKGGLLPPLPVNVYHLVSGASDFILYSIAFSASDFALYSVADASDFVLYSVLPALGLGA